MRFIICKTYEEATEQGTAMIAELVKAKPDCILGLATGSTPMGMYDRLVEGYEAGELDFSRVQCYNLDEYYPISPDNDQSYRYFMNAHLFDRVNIDKQNTYVPHGDAADPQAECAAYEALLDASGGVDLQVLGIGQNGHIGFNEPGEHLNAFTHLTDLSPDTIHANARFFESVADVPRQALTMGMASIMKAKKIVLLATGEAKHAAISAMMSGTITTQVPATLLHLHPDVTVICDRAAADRLYLGVDIGGTDIKFGVVNDRHELLHHYSVPTPLESAEALLDRVVTECHTLMAQYPVSGVGVGSPGIVDAKAGWVISAGNLPLHNTDVRTYLHEALGLPVAVGNDANCASIAELYAGSGVGCRNMVMLTLGTGVGGGIIIDGVPYMGRRGDGAELGHIITHNDGLPCPCGQEGCYEQYASATALIRQTRAAIAAHPDSILAAHAQEVGKVSGRTAFDAARKGCPVAADVVDNWMEEVAAGIRAVRMAFAPDRIVLAGGITNEGEALLVPLKKKCGDAPVALATLKNKAGVIGAAMLLYKGKKK